MSRRIGPLPGGLIAGVLALSLISAACGDDDSSPASTEGTSTTQATTTTTLPAFEGDTSPKAADGFFEPRALLTDVRFADHDGFTRIVFDFEGDESPWWSAEYTAGPFWDIGDDDAPIEVDGTDFLFVALASSGVDLMTISDDDQFRVTYEGDRRIAVGAGSVIEIVQVVDFEGVMEWVIGVDGEREFSVGTLLDPARVYVDIAD